MSSIPTLNGPELAPISGNAPKQLVILLHGVGSDGNDLISLAPEFAPILPDAQFLSPNAPFPCDMAPFGYQWFSLQQRDTAFLLSGIVKTVPILQHYITQSLERFNLSIQQLTIIGFSQGTMMALRSLLTMPEPCAGIIGYSGALIDDGTFTAHITAKPPICLIHGKADDIVPFDAMLYSHATLEQAGISVESHPQPMLAHSINAEGVEAAKHFLQSVYAAHTA